MIVINGKVVPIAGRPVEQGYVRWEGKKIKEIGDMEDLGLNAPPIGAQEKVIDAKGGWIMPGLIDAHCHVGICEEKWGLIADDCNEETTAMTPQLRGVDGINPMDAAFHDAICGGITSLMTGPGSSNVIGGQSVFMKVQGRCVDKMVVKASAAMKIAFGENPKTSYGAKGIMPGSRMAIAAMIREEMYLAKEYMEKKENGTLEKLDFRMESYIPVLRREIPLKAHVHRADDILTAIRIAKEFDVRLTLDHCTEGHLIADEIASSGFPAIVGPDMTSRSKLEVQNMSFKTAGILAKAGVPVAIMTDHPVSLIQYLPLCAGLCVRQGMEMEEALRAITINAAKICGVDDRVGTLEPGKDADIAVFTGNPMETLTKTIATVVDGEVVYKA